MNSFDTYVQFVLTYLLGKVFEANRDISIKYQLVTTYRSVNVNHVCRPVKTQPVETRKN